MSGLKKPKLGHPQLRQLLDQEPGSIAAVGWGAHHHEIGGRGHHCLIGAHDQTGAIVPGPDPARTVGVSDRLPIGNPEDVFGMMTLLGGQGERLVLPRHRDQ
jgi:hypothetical protein